AEVIPKFFHWVGSANVVMAAHNASFDVSFLKFAIARHQLSVPRYHVIDTLSLARRVIHQMPNYKLSTLVELLGLTYGEHHRALADSHHVRNLLQHMVQSADQLEKWEHVLNQNCVLRFGEDEEREDEAGDASPEMTEYLNAIQRAIDEGAPLS